MLPMTSFLGLVAFAKPTLLRGFIGRGCHLGRPFRHEGQSIPACRLQIAPPSRDCRPSRARRPPGDPVRQGSTAGTRHAVDSIERHNAPRALDAIGELEG
jgi:hypothetical protein